MSLLPESPAVTFRVLFSAFSRELPGAVSLSRLLRLQGWDFIGSGGTMGGLTHDLSEQVPQIALHALEMTFQIVRELRGPSMRETYAFTRERASAAQRWSG